MAVTEVDLTAAAAVVVAAYSDRVLARESMGALSVWAALTGCSELTDALRLAQSYADDTTPTIAHVPPL